MRSALSIATETPPTSRLPRDGRPEFVDIQNFGKYEHGLPNGKLVKRIGDGIYRRSENPARNGRSWLALIERRKGDFELKKLTASVKLLNSISWTGDEKDSRLSSNTRRRMVFAVRSINGLRPGPVLTLFDKPMGSLNEEGYSDTELISTGYRREFIIGSKSFVLRTSLGVSKDGSKLAVLVIESEGKSPVVKVPFISPPTIVTLSEASIGLAISTTMANSTSTSMNSTKKVIR